MAIASPQGKGSTPSCAVSEGLDKPYWAVAADKRRGGVRGDRISTRDPRRKVLSVLVWWKIDVNIGEELVDAGISSKNRSGIHILKGFIPKRIGGEAFSKLMRKGYYMIRFIHDLVELDATIQCKWARHV